MIFKALIKKTGLDTLFVRVHQCVATSTIIFTVLATSNAVYAGAVWVEGYERPDGTRVEAHYLFHANDKYYDREQLLKSGEQIEAAASIPDPLPENAKLNYLGTDWDCIRGFRRLQQQCEQIVIPDNAVLNQSGDGWECTRGFHQEDNQCVQIEIPANARLNFYGNSWDCKPGFVQKDDHCEEILIPDLAELIAEKLNLKDYNIFIISFR